MTDKSPTPASTPSSWTEALIDEGIAPPGHDLAALVPADAWNDAVRFLAEYAPILAWLKNPDPLNPPDFPEPFTLRHLGVMAIRRKQESRIVTPGELPWQPTKRGLLV